MTPEEKAECMSDFYTFTQKMFLARKGVEMRLNFHQRLICEALEKVVLGKTKRLIINIPPRSGKTEISVLNFVAWATGLFPDSEWIHVSYSKRLASNNTYGIREIMRNESYKEIFPYVEIKSDSDAKDEFRTNYGGIIYATGSDGSITGRGAGGMSGRFQGGIIIDDPHKPGEANSELVRSGVLNWFQETLESRKNNPDTPIIVIMQRLHEEDLAGWLINGGNGEEWETLVVPAINEDGTSFWERQFPLEMLERLERTNPYVFAGQYLQLPAPKDGGTFKPANIQIIDALPHGIKWIRGWDLASTVKKTSDYTSSTKLGIKDGVTYIAEVHRFKGTPDEVENTITQKANLDGRDTLISLPQDPGQAGVYQKNALSRALSGYTFEFTPESGDKQTRASPFASQVNVGNVKMLRGEWNDEFIKEMQMFPNGKHDDMIDSTSRAYNKASSKPLSAFDVLF
ncbi:phage terminase large subunit [Proteus mirabilis]|uniref:phage terminase large subunit n=1 Tax=Proteus mirabilis TaxID=584 RepID=UPI0035575237